MKKLLVLMSGIICTGALALGQSAGQSTAPAPAAPAPNQITPQVLGEMLRSAATFHDLVQNLNLSKSLGPDVHSIGPDGLPKHSVERTAETIGAGAGVGAAIGGMSHNPNGVLIGALIGGAGGLIVDEILKHREETHPKPVEAPVPDARPLRQ